MPFKKNPYNLFNTNIEEELNRKFPPLFKDECHFL